VQRVDVGFVVDPRFGFDARPGGEEADDVPADCGDALGVFLAERKGGRERRALPVFDEAIDVDAAQDHVPSGVVDKAAAVDRIGDGVQRG